MVKLTLCLILGACCGMAALLMRQQQLELRHRAAVAQQRIHAMQAQLWEQQLRIAVETAPNALAQSLGRHDLSLGPEARLPDGAGDWIRMKVKAVDAN